jgi:hypothetical protein
MNPLSASQMDCDSLIVNITSNERVGIFKANYGFKSTKSIKLHGGIHGWGTTFGCLTEKILF